MKNKTYYQLKTVFIGDHYTGKSTLVNYLTSGKISPFIDSTIGCAFSTITRENENTPIQFQIWDTAGQERYRALSPLYFRNADIVLICFSVDSIDSFNNLTIWLKLLKEKVINDNIIYFLIANKCDLKWKISQKQMEDFSKKHSLILYQTSSYSNIGIDSLLDTIISNSKLKWENKVDTISALDSIDLVDTGYCNSISNKCCN